jgi:hypothetical protein
MAKSKTILPILVLLAQNASRLAWQLNGRIPARNRPKFYLTITTPQNEKNKSIIVIFVLTLVILQILGIF